MKNKSKKKNFFQELKTLFVLVVAAFTIKATLVEIYIVPTGSMEDTILTGDMLIGNKFIYGMRTPMWVGIPYTRIGFKTPHYRLPKFTEIKNGDVTIFEFPRDPFQKYVKRCIGIAGDTIHTVDRELYVNGKFVEFPIEGKHINQNKLPKDQIQSVIWSYFKGNMDNLSDFVVPYKGMEIDFEEVEDWQSIITLLVQDGNEVRLADRKFTTIDPTEISRMHGFLKYWVLSFFYSDKRKLKQKEKKEKEQHYVKLMNNNKSNKIYTPWQIPFSSIDKIDILDNLYINDISASDLKKIRLRHNYYFFMGDNRDNSWDSRFWGFVPDYHILGKPVYSVINTFNLNSKFFRFRVVS
ncbi:MAG: signal peptidase I [Candidatus Marinimicrobia bacterium]|nr:signal peptidase I [Candidatus Neomarinimicrobiota bacterium]|tara:strand:- start:213 stop:1268 length:1056 start_codon:yes stop_codon:yes gene_type:complete